MIFDSRITDLPLEEATNAVARALRRANPDLNVSLESMRDGWRVTGSGGDGRGVTIEVKRIENSGEITKLEVDVWGNDREYARRIMRYIDRELTPPVERPRIRG